MEPIAILGRGCVLPGAVTPEALWEAVAAGRDLTSAPPEGRWGLDPSTVLTRPGAPLEDRTLGGRGGYVRGFESAWDPDGFAVPAAELAGLDPVCLWLLASARAAWREAGGERFDPERVGAIVANLSYPTRGLADVASAVWRDADARDLRFENRFVSGYPAHLLAKALGLGGPAFALDAACASSLYALKLACDRFADGSVDAMVVGAVNAADNLFLHMGFTALGALSKSGASRPFSRRADGLLPAEGAAAVVLVRARDVDPARKDVFGVIRGVGVSNDGRRRGLLAPDGDGQREALERAYAAADVDPASVSLVECHATGTPAGDPIEIEGLNAVFARSGDLPVGSLKSNTGHLITVAGLGGLLKLLGALAHDTRPATLHAEDAIDAFAQGPARPLLEPEPWPAGDAPRRAGLSAFGFGGSNAHLVLEEWRPATSPRLRPARASPPDAVVICGVGASAGDARGVREILARLEAPPPKRPAARRETIEVDLALARSPPADLKKTLAQQTLLFEAVDEALAGIIEPAAERVGVFVGMGCDAEAARWALRWRDASEAEKDSIVAPLDAAAVLGAMPNVPANRLNARHDWRGQGFTVSGEELSGLDALAVGADALRRGELDLAVVGAVDLSDEAVHAEAVRRLIGEQVVPGDAAVVLTLKRRADAVRDGDPILATLEPAADDDADATGPDDPIAQALAARFGVAHAASSLLALGVAAAAGARRRRIEPDGARAWLAAEPALTVTAQSFTGRVAGARLSFDTAALPMRLGKPTARRAARGAGKSSVVGGEVALVFTGAAAAYPGMGRELLAAFPDAAARVATRFGEADDVARGLARDPKMLAAPFEQLRATTLLSQVHAEIALGLLKLEPTAALGLSSGETNALLAFGAWRDPDALLDEVRQSSMYEHWLAGRCEAAGAAWDVKPGTPIVWRCWRLLAPVEQVRAALTDIPRVTLPIVHGPSDCVIAGEAEACRLALARLDGAPATPLGQDMVVHCAEAAPFAEDWRRIHARETWPVEGVRFYANATNASYVPTRDAAADMLTAQAIAPIDFARTVEQAWSDGFRVFVELGPRDALTRAVASVLGERPHLAVAFDRVDRGDVAQVADTAAALHAAGVALDLDALETRLAVLAANGAPAPTPKTPLRLPAHPPPVPRIQASRIATDLADANVLVLKRPPRLAPAREPMEERLVAAGGGAMAPAPRLAAISFPPPLEGEGAGGWGERDDARERARAAVPPPGVEIDRRREHPAPYPLPLEGRGRGSSPSEERTPSGPRFARAELEAAARSKISDLFGPTFARQDGYARQVRMPAPPLLLADRVTGIDAEPGVLGRGTIWTETDIAPDAWHLHAGRMQPGIVIESGQADLLLASYMGADFLNESERVYRLLGCELTFHDHLPAAGDTLRFQIDIERHANLGDVRLFFFGYDARVGDRPLLSVRSGQAGFFTDGELAASAGVLWDAETSAPPTAEPRLAPLPRASAKRAFSKANLDALHRGDAHACFGTGFERASAHQRSPRPPSDRLRMIDAVEAFEPAGGPWGRGYLRATADAPADAWFYDGHFHNDPCMPGTLMAEAAVQAVELFMIAAGMTLERDGWRFEPATSEAFKFICRGQVIPDRDHTLRYEVFVDEIVDEPEPTVFAALLARSDGFKVFACPRFGVRLVRDWPIGDRPQAKLIAATPRIVSPEGGPLGDVRGDIGALTACAWGRPSDAFGPMYARFDRESSVPRLPGPPYHAVSRIVSVSHPPGAPATDITVVAEYDPPADAWYFDANAHAVMPFAVLTEVLLQPCGWLASYCGFALEGGLAFRNLDGASAVVRREVRPGDGPLQVEAKLTRWSKAGPLTIVFFDVVCRSGRDELMTLSTSFGFFPKAALASQAGLPTTDEMRARLTESAPLASVRKRTDGRTPLPRPPLAMIDAVTGFWPEGGEAGLGRIRGRQAVDPNAWYFKAHFYEDPVQPGSLGLDALLQLLERAMVRKGLDEDFAAPRFETPVLGVAMTWKYRGQVTPEAKEVVTTLDVTSIAREPGAVLATAKASLWVDGLRIYEADGLSARIVEGEPARTRVETLSLALQPWLADHRPTLTLPALPMAGALAQVGGLVLEGAAPYPLIVEDFALKRWIVVEDEPVALATRATPRGAGRFDLTLAADGLLAGAGRARVGGPAPPTEVWPALDNLAPVDDLYANGALFHGPRFHLLTDVRRSASGAEACLDVARAFDPDSELDVGLLDALLHAIPHDAPELWFGRAAEGFAAYPHTIERLTVHRPRPRQGVLTVRARPLDGGDARSVRLAVRAEDADGPWIDLVLREALMPKGPLGLLPPAERRGFLAEGRAVEGAGLARADGVETVLLLADVAASDWLPGTLARAYRLAGASADAAREIATKEHAARAWGVHPREVTVDGDAATCGARRLRVDARLDRDARAWRIATPADALPPDPAPEVEVVAVDDAALLALVQHQRYEILVGEQKLSPPGADDARRIVADELDRAGRSFAAFDGAALVGSVRVNVVADGGADAFATAYGLATLGPGWEARTAIVTRLVSRSARGRPLLSKLVAAVLGVVAARDTRWIAIGVEDPLIGFYESMGFARFRDAVRSPSGGMRTVLVLDVEDPRHRDKATLAGWLYPSLFAPPG
jgi:acyl transferase domain-containing protein/3-hydroxymyristoyl/3-hydroxydecanoyl-(acyl carrier protein) dehydratase